MSQILTDYKNKIEASYDKITSEADFRKNDQMVDYVFKVGKDLFSINLDKTGHQWLLQTGGRLAGAYSYLGNKVSQKRAERDLCEQRVDELINTKTVENYHNGDEKITLARAQAKRDLAELKEVVILKDNEKNNYENIANACEKMISFIQSAIKVKEGERFMANKLHAPEYETQKRPIQ